MLEELELQGFDPTGMKIEKGARGTYRAKSQIEEGQITFIVKKIGDIGGDKKFQLFGAITGLSLQENDAVFPDYQPLSETLLFDAIKSTVASSADFAAFKTAVAAVGFTNAFKSNSVFWEADGSLTIFVNGTNGQLNISCLDMPYRQFLKTLETSVVITDMVKFGFNLDNSLNNVWNLRRIGMLGSDENNNINPRTYFDPAQNQGKLVNVKQAIAIDSSLELNSTFKDGETELSFVLDVVSYSNNAWHNRA